MRTVEVTLDKLSPSVIGKNNSPVKVLQENPMVLSDSKGQSVSSQEPVKGIQQVWSLSSLKVSWQVLRKT